MASHCELKPADGALALMLASAAMEKASRNTTVLAGSVIVDNGDGTQTWIGGSGSDRSCARDAGGGVVANVGDMTIPGTPTGLSLSCVDRRIHVMWDGTLEGGLPDDFSHVTVYARATDDGAEEEWGSLNGAGVLVGRRMTAGTIVDVSARAFDTAHAPDGSYCPNIGPRCDLLSIIVEDDASMQDILELEERADALSKKAERVRSDLQSEVDDVRTKVDGLSGAGDRLSGQITDIRGTVNGQQSRLDEFGQKLEGAVTQNGATVNSVTELRQTVSGLDARVAQNTETAEGAMGKATAVQQTADGIKATLGKDYTPTKDADRKYSTKTELTTEAGRIRAELSETTKTANGALDRSAALEATVNGIQSTISEQATKLDSTVKTANEAKSTADSNKTTISQVSTTASDALSKATTVEANLNGYKTTVSETYATKTDMRSGDATVQANVDQLATDAMNTYVQSSTFTQTRDSFTQELSQTKQDVTDANTAIAANEETRRKYMRFSGADTGDPQIELGASDSAFKMRLTNRRLAFMQGDSTPTYVSNQRLYINDAEVNQTLRIGKYAFIPRPDGHMSLQYVG